MQITNIKLTNFRRHRSLEVPLRPGVIGVSGRNGAGKSSLLEGLYFGITGGSIGGDAEKSLVTWGQKRGEVRLDFEAEGKKGTLVRRVGGVAASLEIEGEDKVVGIRGVNARVEELMAASLDSLREILFVPQEGLDTPLRGTEAARKEAFGKLFGCHRLEAVRAVIQNAAAGLAGESEEALRKQREVLTDLLATAEKEAAQAAQALEALKAAGPLGDVRELYDRARAVPRSSVEKERQELLARLEEYDKALKDFSQEEISSWNKEEAARRLAHAKNVITLFDSGVCPTCGLTGGGTGTTREAAEAEVVAALLEIGRQAEFDRLVDGLLAVDDSLTKLDGKVSLEDSAIEEAKEALRKRGAAEQALHDAHSRDGAAKARVESAKTALRQHEEKEKRAARAAETAGVLSRVRECLHRDALQADVRAYGTGLINRWLTETLSVFSVPYQVYFDPDGLLRFKSPPAEEEHDFLALSGGQRKLVALAYRLALVRLFMGNLGLAVLDEPTPFIDEENVETMRESFQSLKRFSDKRNMTVLVATHERRLFSAFDSVIEL